MAMSLREQIRTLAIDTTTGYALIPEDLRPILVEYTRFASGWVEQIRHDKAEQQEIKITKRLTLPPAYNVGDGGVPPGGQSTYSAKVPLYLKAIDGLIGVTGLQRSANNTTEVDRTYSSELKGQLIAIGHKHASDTLWGDANVDVNIPSGLDTEIVTNRWTKASGSMTLTLPYLDTMICAMRDYWGGDNAKMALVMSAAMRQKVAGLYLSTYKTNLLTTDMLGIPKLGYDDIPILINSFCGGKRTTAAGTAAASATSGSMTAGTHKYRIAWIGKRGEDIASVYFAVTLTSQTSADITLPALPTIVGSSPAVKDAVFVKIYRTAVGGSAYGFAKKAKLQNYDAKGNIVSYVTTINDGTADAALNMAELPLEAGGEYIFGVNLEPEQSMTMFYLPRYNADETIDNRIWIKDYPGGQDADEKIIGMYRGLGVHAEIFSGCIRNVSAT